MSGVAVQIEKHGPKLPVLVGVGLVAAALFSTTFVINRAISLSGGHWVWSAVLRYAFTILFVAGWIAFRNGIGELAAIARALRAQPLYWMLAGGLGCGVFYTSICFAASQAPGWIVAATWQLTIFATTAVLWGFGTPAPLRGVVMIGVIVAGVMLVNLESVKAAPDIASVSLAAIPVLLAAFAYPLGNQLLNRKAHSADPMLRQLLRRPTSAVLLMALGSVPFFCSLAIVTAPSLPSAGQIGATVLVAILAGGLATSLFLYARNASSDPYRIAVIDATQGSEAVFALALELAFLGQPTPGLPGWLGLLAIAGGLAGLTFGNQWRS